ncbi:MAG: aldose 1-epimerase family protein, partial [Blautia sp.]|nr:aldose 1-epimerase family protein [Blautia sp.]
EDCFVLGKEEFQGLTDGRLPLKHDLFDEDAIVLENTKGRVALKCEKSPSSIRVEYDDRRYIGFWHCPRTEAPYVCIEPWSSLPSRKGIVEELETQEDLVSLMPGETYTGTIRITIC